MLRSLFFCILFVIFGCRKTADSSTESTTSVATYQPILGDAKAYQDTVALLYLRASKFLKITASKNADPDKTLRLQEALREVLTKNASPYLSGDIIDLPFPVLFYGISYPKLKLSSNGYVTFNTSDPADALVQSLPSTGAPNNLVALFWQDKADPAQKIYTQTIDTAPNRIFIVLYDKPVQGLIAFFEKSTNMGTLCMNCKNKGLENADGTIGYDFEKSIKQQQQIKELQDNSKQEIAAYIPKQTDSSDSTGSSGSSGSSNNGTGFPIVQDALDSQLLITGSIENLTDIEKLIDDLVTKTIESVATGTTVATPTPAPAPAPEPAKVCRDASSSASGSISCN
ncbi:MAG: hypothetical protein WCK42_02020 [Myxococcaceae bacterium]